MASKLRNELITAEWLRDQWGFAIETDREINCYLDYEGHELLFDEGCFYINGAYFPAIKTKQAARHLFAALNIKARIQPAQAEPVEVGEPWKPGMRVLIEATIGEEIDDDTCDLRIHTGLSIDAWIVAKLSQLRPLPVVQGGD